jgi:putative transposase
MRRLNSLRLASWNYRWPGVYSVTLVTHGRRPIFGTVASGEMRLSEEGRIAHEEWLRTEQMRDYLRLDAFVIMPDHIHAILVFDEHTPGAPAGGLPDDDPTESPTRTFKRPAEALGSVIAGYKAVVTGRIRTVCGNPRMRVWQRNYWDRIIRDEREWESWRAYIDDNPRRWTERYG